MEWLMVFALVLLLVVLSIPTFVALSDTLKTAGSRRVEWPGHFVNSVDLQNSAQIRGCVLDTHGARIILIATGLLVAGVMMPNFWKRPHYLLPLLAFIAAAVYAADLLPRWMAGSLSVAGSMVAALGVARGLPCTLSLAEILGAGGCTLLVMEILLGRRATGDVDTRFRALLEACPIPVLIAGKNGFVEFANAAAQRCLQPRSGSVVGDPLAAFLPDLDRALRHDECSDSEASLKCTGRRDREGSFTAEVYFTRFREHFTEKLAAVIANVEDLAEASGSIPQPYGTLVELADGEKHIKRFPYQCIANEGIAEVLDVARVAAARRSRHVPSSRTSPRSEETRLPRDRAACG
jgi:PAS domain-containing protein